MWAWLAFPPLVGRLCGSFPGSVCHVERLMGEGSRWPRCWGGGTWKPPLPRWAAEISCQSRGPAVAPQECGDHIWPGLALLAPHRATSLPRVRFVKMVAGWPHVLAKRGSLESFPLPECIVLISLPPLLCSGALGRGRGKAALPACFLPRSLSPGGGSGAQQM